MEKRVQYIEPSPDTDPASNKYQHITPKSIGSIIRSFKAAMTRWCRENSLEGRIWQRNYYEHVIRNGKSLNKIRQYIMDNPLNWQLDIENPATVSQLDGRKAEEKFRRELA